ncbi:aminopeptidase P family protein [Longispora sp. NPDC051575]|uniref:aminopeptidase P family protein n=1 Tax=Longispora sp. NPDC051575 TaxID=3154943 RepID=UPI003414190E
MTEERPEGERSHDPMFPEKFLEFMRTGWAESPLNVLALPQSAHHARRRDQLSAAFPGENLVVPTGREQVRANDTDYPFRPGSDFMWLTGEHDPESVLILHPTATGHDAVLYVRPRSPKDTDAFFRNAQHGELWVGRRQTLAEKTTELGLPTADLADLPKALADLAPGRTRVLRGYDAAVDGAVLVTDAARDAELAKVLSELRLVKDAWEIAQLQDAIDATVRGFEDVTRILPADRAVSERLLDGVFALRARHDGNDVGYGSIVGNGAHATILHWTRNNGRTQPGDLLLMDMGVENNNLYTADVTRTLPVSGRFTDLQRAVYDVVYASQQAGIDAVKPGVEYKEIRDTCNRVLAEGLGDLGVLPGSVEEALSADAQYFRRWTLHGFGHMLGLDVHDCAHASKEMYTDGKLDTGYVLTVEPGLYFQAEDELVPAELRGIGVRIEDDIQVTENGSVNLSAGLPRTAAEVESWMAAQREAGPRLPG